MLCVVYVTLTLFMQDIYFIIYKDIIIFNIHLCLFNESIIKIESFGQKYFTKTNSYKIVMIMKIYITSKHYY